MAAGAATAAVGIDVPPAAAHICPVAIQIPVGQVSTVAVGVTVEDATVPDVEIDIPAGMTLDRVDPTPGWTFARRASSVRFRGGPIAAFTCQYFSLGVTAATKGAFGIPVTQRTNDGTVVARTTPDVNSASDRALDQFVYAGVQPPATPGGSGGPSTTTILGAALLGIGVVMAVALTIRARREARLRNRLDEFKKRLPDPPA
jgi:hypothetical protein